MFLTDEDAKEEKSKLYVLKSDVAIQYLSNISDIFKI